MKRKLDRLRGLDESVLKRMAPFKTVEELLQKTVVELVQNNGICESEAREALRLASESVCPKLTRVSDLAATTYLTTQISPLDQHLHGGLSAKSITEVVGPAGAGKTQFCHQMAVQAAMPISENGLGGSVVYIDTEGSFSADRLVDMGTARFPHHFNSVERCEELASKVFVYHTKTSSELNDTLQNLETVIIKENVKLIILDSVASAVRREFNSGEIVARQAMLIEQAQRLKKLGESFDLPVLVTNQVTTAVRDIDSSVTAALGPLWAHAVNTRLILEFLGDLDIGSRRLWVAKSPIASVACLEFDIAQKGIVASSLEMLELEANYWGTHAIANKRSVN